MCIRDRSPISTFEGFIGSIMTSSPINTVDLFLNFTPLRWWIKTRALEPSNELLAIVWSTLSKILENPIFFFDSVVVVAILGFVDEMLLMLKQE